MNLLNHIDRLLIDVTLQEGPNFCHFFRDLSHRVTVEWLMASSLKRDPVHILEIDYLLLKECDLVPDCLGLVQDLEPS